jgi:N-acetyl-alpha-D-muramate 1-phosphate uridylyltransferase
MNNRKAMIMAAGIGTRLQPLTNTRPKALIEYEGKTLLQYCLEKLKKFNFSDVIINIHHFPEMIKDYLHNNQNFGLTISFSDESDELLETGGALKKASWFFDSGPFLVCNVDVQTDLNLNNLYDYHIAHSGLATLAVTSRKTTRPFLMDERHHLCGWRNEISGEEIISRASDNLLPVGFSCYYMLDPGIFEYIHDTGKFSITPILLNISRNNPVHMYKHNDSWIDLGRIESFSR